MKYLYYYIGIINLISFMMMGIDKSKAQKNKWRISEKTLFLSALIGGSLGIALGMKGFHHKTKHNSFIFGIPAIIIMQIILCTIIYINSN